MVEEDKGQSYVVPYREGAAPMGEGSVAGDPEESKESGVDAAATVQARSVLNDLQSTTIQRKISGEK